MAGTCSAGSQRPQVPAAAALCEPAAVTCYTTGTVTNNKSGEIPRVRIVCGVTPHSGARSMLAAAMTGDMRATVPNMQPSPQTLLCRLALGEAI
jgi:hypothetical protein